MNFKSVDMKKAFKTVIVQSGMRQSEIAERMNFSGTRLSLLINQKEKRAKLCEIEAFCRATDVSVSYLVKQGEVETGEEVR